MGLTEEAMNGSKGHDHSFNPNPKTLTWERLEAQRLKKLKLTNRYSKHFNVLRTSREETASANNRSFELSGSKAGLAQAVKHAQGQPQKGPSPSCTERSNSLAPFATVEKPTCGYFFNDRTDHRKMNFGIPASDLVKWRNFSAN